MSASPILLALALVGAPFAAQASDPPCGALTIEDCVKARPDAARRQLRASLSQKPDGYAARLLGDLLAPDHPAEATALYRRSYESGDLWGSIAYAKHLGSGQGVSADPTAAIAILEKAAEASNDAAPWVLYDAAILRTARAAPGDEAEAVRLHVRAVQLGNPWSTIPLAHRLAGGKPVDIGARELANWMERALPGAAPDFARHGRVALARLRLETREASDEARGLALLSEVEAMGGEEGRRAGVERASRLLEAGSKRQRAQAKALLEAQAADGFAPALFTLGRREAREPASEAARTRAVRRLEAAIAKDASLAAYGWYLVGDAWRESRRPAAAALARKAYERAAQSGNGWADMRLAQGRFFGTWIKRSARLARFHADRAARSDNPDAALVAFLSLQGTRYDAPGRLVVDQTRRALERVSAERLADILASASDNGRVRFAQAVWRDHGLYSGPVDGVANRRTMRLFAAECRRLAIAECRRRLMPAPLMTALLRSLQDENKASEARAALDRKS